MDKYTIINLRKKGESNRSISKLVGIDRKTVARIFREYDEGLWKLESKENLSREDVDVITRQIVGEKQYDSSKRYRTKLSEEIKVRIEEIIENEVIKTKELGGRHKQKLSCAQIVEILHEENYDIGHTTVSLYVAEVRKSKEVFIRQSYEYGHRLEYDFGEVKLIINDKKEVLYIAVFGAPASKYRYAYLYKSQKQEVFLDSHVRFFEMNQGSWLEVTYDNMRNVISKFIGRNKKELNEKLVNLALYYGFEINVTNSYSGNEKGFVESSVKKIRQYVFTKEYRFNSYEDACSHLTKKLEIMNSESTIEEERKYLQPAKIRYELAETSEVIVDKYSCIRVENNFYSVPDYLREKRVFVKNYIDTILVYINNEFVCVHKKIDGYRNYQLDIRHYLKTLYRKPGALINSLVLKKQPDLNTIYQNYFKTKPKLFIEIIQKNKENDLEVIIKALRMGVVQNNNTISELDEEITNKSKQQINSINELFNMKGNENGNN